MSKAERFLVGAVCMALLLGVRHLLDFETAVFAGITLLLLDHSEVSKSR